MEVAIRIILFCVVLCHGGTWAEKLCFPKNFLFGVSTSAFQIEGAWNYSDKGESIWDRYTHQHPERVFDHTNADVAADSFHHLREDIKLLKELGVQYYRFSIAWSRVLPTGFSNVVSADGVKYYNTLIDELIAAGIKPLVTMYHYDLPQSLQDLGGWTNPAVADYFKDYARVLFNTFGDRVEGWITFNEPYTFCLSGYGGNDAPGMQSSGFETYLCGHNILRAHAMTYHLYHNEMDARGFITITLDMSWMEAATKDDEDAAERARQFIFGWFAHPILSNEGDYPPVMRQRIDELSRKQNFPRSRLPVFTAEEVKSIRGTVDIIGLNTYSAYLVSEGHSKVDKTPSFQNDMNVSLRQDPTWPRSNSSWLRDVPWGFRKILNWIKETYNNPPIVVTENGVSTVPGLKDVSRVSYIDGHLRALHAAIVEDKVDVRGYTYWSLIDNFEWMRGFSERFGLYEVDYASANKRRTPRLSAAYYSNVARTSCLPTPQAVTWLRNHLQ